MKRKRSGRAERKTKETAVSVDWCLDGSGTYEIHTGVGFFDHMLSLLAKHGLFDLKVSCQGDLEVDSHHSVEDVGICMGEALDMALKEKSGIQRYGLSYVPMGDALARAVIDISGRSHIVFGAAELLPRVGEYDTELAEEFFKSVADRGKLNVHLDLIRGTNTHHCLEALFKAFGKALDQATARSERIEGVMSTKGTL